MIFWKDFILDDVLGPVLSPEIFEQESEIGSTSCREERFGSPRKQPGLRPGSQEDAAMGVSALIQETGQEQRPARMVGHSSLDSSVKAQTHRDVTSGNRTENLRLVGRKA